MTALVVFKADRLSRNALEYPVVIDRLRRLGCEVWSVADAPGGKLLALDTQMDKFIRFLEGWQAETESQNTSIRVSEAMRQLAHQGRWSGGPPPYGYRLNESRRPRSPAPALVIEPAQAEAVQLMVRLYLEERMGCKLIAGELNRRAVPHPGGRPWDDQRVRRILQNPIIAGLPAYGRTRPGGGRGRTARNPYDLDQFILPRDEQGNLRPIPEYQIVPLERWLRLLRAMAANRSRPSGGEARQGLTQRHRAADGLLTGMLFCGHCGARLSASVGHYKLPRQDGTVTLSRRPYYVCQTHSHRGRQFCDGQRTYGRKRLEQAVTDQVRRVLNLLDPAELQARLREGWPRHDDERRGLEAELARGDRVLTGWLERMDLYLADPGGSPYTEEMLAEKIRGARERREALSQRLAQFSRAPDPAPAPAGDWWTCFEQAPPAAQKLLLRDLIDRVVVRREEVEVIFRPGLGAFGGSVVQGHHTPHPSYRAPSP